MRWTFVALSLDNHYFLQPPRSGRRVLPGGHAVAVRDSSQQSADYQNSNPCGAAAEVLFRKASELKAVALAVVLPQR